MNHLKLFLLDDHPDIQHFEISHGYNLVWINRAWFIDDLIVHLGAGWIITHPDIIVRNQTNYKDGYAGNYLSGPTVQASLQRRFTLSPSWFVSLEGKLVWAYATIPIVDGSVDVQNRSLHANFGLGYNF